MKHLAWMAAAAAVLAACSSSGGGPVTGTESSGGSGLPALTVTSAQWRDGTPLAPPVACTDNAHLGHSPALSWTGAPPATSAFAITVLDPDAGDFLHWALLDVPPATTSLPEAASPGGTLPAGARELTNGFGKPGYGGPCPPPGQTHHYVLTVWALNRTVTATDELPGAALASGAVTATFSR